MDLLFTNTEERMKGGHIEGDLEKPKGKNQRLKGKKTFTPGNSGSQTLCPGNRQQVGTRGGNKRNAKGKLRRRRGGAE